VTQVVFKEWLPDLPAWGNPGLLTANNVEPLATVYKSFATLQNTGGPVVPGSEIYGVGLAYDSGGADYYAATDDGIFESSNGTGAFTARSATMGAASYEFLQYENLLLVTSANGPLFRTVGSASNFVTLGSAPGTAPAFTHIGRVGQFILGTYYTAGASRIRWSGIDDPTSWPAPGSATAIAQQSGEQITDPTFGIATGFSSGDQFALVFQQGSITRITYVGGNAVFQFDTISDKIGCQWPKSIVRIGGITYFMNRDGVFRTDGVTVQNLSENKCSKFLADRVTVLNEDIYGVYHRIKKLIYWSYSTTGAPAFTATKMLILNPEDGRFTTADYAGSSAIYGSTGVETIYIPNNVFIWGFGLSNTLGSLSGTAGSAVLETGDSEFSEGGRTYIDGIKPLVESSGTAPAIGVRVGFRDDLGTAPSYTSTTAPFARTGYANFRSDAKYHRVELNLTGNFEKAVGFEYIAKPAGGA
jgi:hypothetical protein